MLSLFSNAKINLALNPPPGHFTAYSIGRLFFRPTMNKVTFDPHVIANLQTFFHESIPQIKARHFEIPACGGFTMTAVADDLDKFYVPGKEMVMYKNDADLAEKVHYYLAHEEERAAIARAGYERTIREHTYEKRFGEIFKAIGLKAG
jgi:spore maturation protein CgeB